MRTLQAKRFGYKARTTVAVAALLLPVTQLMYSGFFDSSARQLIRCDYSFAAARAVNIRLEPTVAEQQS